MELRAYWGIVRKRIWIVMLLLLVLLLSYPFLGPAQAPQLYSASMRFVVGIAPEPLPPEVYGYDRYYTWLTAEYLIDDMSEVVKSRAFAEDVAEVSGRSIPVGAIQGATASGKLHRILTISASWGDPKELATIANAIVQVMRERSGTYFGQLGTENAVVALIDPPVVSPIGRSLRQRLDLPLRLTLALALGVALTFLLDYLDDSVRHRADLEALGIDLLAQVPSQRTWLARFLQRRLP